MSQFLDQNVEVLEETAKGVFAEFESKGDEGITNEAFSQILRIEKKRIR